MTRDEIIGGINSAWRHAVALGIAESFANPTPFSPNNRFKDASLDGRRSYEDVYLFGLSDVQYNFILSDYSFFQFSGGIDESVRFAFYPNPFFGASADSMSELGELREYVEEGAVTVDQYLLRVAEMREARSVPPVRYEHAPSQYKELEHPCSHLHLGFYDAGRWPGSRVLTPLAFVLLIFKLFYSQSVQESAVGLMAGELCAIDAALIAEKNNCRILPEALFSKNERAQFALG